MRKTIVAGNWKLNGNMPLCDRFIDVANSAASTADVLICPPAVLIAKLADGLAQSGWSVGGQNLASETSGAYTGEISASLLKEAGADYVIVGHSERRSYYAERDELVAKKTALALAEGLTPIVCVGEDLACREAGQAEEFVERQLLASLDSLDQEQLPRVVVAYEPVWAIGTGVTATAEQAQSMHAHIREALASKVDSSQISVLYGGSVNAANAEQLIGQPDIDGALVGGASLKPEEFLAIIDAANN